MEIVMRNIDELKPFAKNPKKHPEKQIEMLKKSMGEFGFTNPILTSQDDMIIAGHGRMEAAKAIGLTEVPTIHIDLPYEKAVAYVIADNRLAELAEEDSEMLAELLGEIDTELYDSIGFSQNDLDELLEDIAAQNPDEIVEDEAPEVSQGEPITQRGDIWTLGNHRLMCGDSTDTADVSKLMDGNKADMVFTDPPYGYEYQSNMRIKTEKFDVLLNDDKLLEFMPNVKKFCNGFVFICASWKNLDEWYGIFKEHLELSNLIIWDKGGGGMGDLEKTFSTDYEVMLVSNGGNALTDKRIGSVWDIKKDSASSYEHATQKPVGLPAMAINHTTASRANVLDLFGGSGSTMMACEQTGRINYSMELDEKYCDVIIQRYVNLTGDDELTRNGELYVWKGSDE